MAVVSAVEHRDKCQQSISMIKGCIVLLLVCLYGISPLKKGFNLSLAALFCPCTIVTTFFMLQ